MRTLTFVDQKMHNLVLGQIYSTFRRPWFRTLASQKISLAIHCIGGEPVDLYSQSNP